MELTKDAKKLISTLYIEYTEKRKRGIGKSDAKKFEYEELIMLPHKMPANDVTETCEELKRIDFLSFKRWINGGYSEFTLADSAIIMMENLTADTVQKGFDNLTKLIP
jgi:hypothetical protein